MKMMKMKASMCLLFMSQSTTEKATTQSLTMIKDLKLKTLSNNQIFNSYMETRSLLRNQTVYIKVKRLLRLGTILLKLEIT